VTFTAIISPSAATGTVQFLARFTTMRSLKRVADRRIGTAMFRQALFSAAPDLVTDFPGDEAAAYVKVVQ
jgi:hypothetical protein